jgi:alpha-beta hydrolase superfamily lysophospholipase
VLRTLALWLQCSLALTASSALAGGDSDKCQPPPGTQLLSFSSDGNQLRGFVDLPPSAGPHPIVLIAHGSGTTDVFHGDTPYNGRYELLRKTFRDAGFATAVWDKAGNGCSSGKYSSGNPIRERARETVAALGALEQRSDIDARRMGVWGISQGGWIGPMVAVQTDDVAFLILVSAPAHDAISALEYQALATLRRQGVPPAEVALVARHLRRALAIVRAGGAAAEYEAAIEPLRKYPVFLELGITIEGTAEDLRKWQNEVDFQYRVDTAVLAMHQPVLVLLGDRDDLIDWRESQRRFAQWFRESDNRRSQVKVLKRTDHNMTNGSETKPTDEYLETLRAWLSRLRYGGGKR